MRYDINVVKTLYELSNPIIQYRIDRDFRDLNVEIEDYIKDNNPLLDYWLHAYKGRFIHGAKDECYENAIGKLLDFGFTSSDHEFDGLFGKITETEFWQRDSSFNSQLNKTVIYPFLIRAGYLHNPKVSHYLLERIEMIEKSIKKYGYDLEKREEDKPSKHKGVFVFKNDIARECLPTIYDLYAFAYYPNKQDDLYKRIEKIVEYILDERFLFLPDQGYVYDGSNGRYYASGNVYHACLRQERILLMIYLLSFFKVSRKSEIFMKQVQKLVNYSDQQGFYKFDRELIKEKKNLYQIYTGGHMGLGENRRSKSYVKIESTFWMMAILKNLE